MSNPFDEVNRQAAKAAGMTDEQGKMVQQALRRTSEDVVSITCDRLLARYAISPGSTCASILQAAIIGLREYVPHAPIFDWIRAIADASEAVHAGGQPTAEQVDRLHRLVIEMQQHARAVGKGGGGTVQ